MTVVTGDACAYGYGARMRDERTAIQSRFRLRMSDRHGRRERDRIGMMRPPQPSNPLHSGCLGRGGALLSVSVLVDLRWVGLTVAASPICRLALAANCHYRISNAPAPPPGQPRAREGPRARRTRQTGCALPRAARSEMSPTRNRSLMSPGASRAMRARRFSVPLRESESGPTGPGLSPTGRPGFPGSGTSASANGCAIRRFRAGIEPKQARSRVDHPGSGPESSKAIVSRRPSSREALRLAHCAKQCHNGTAFQGSAGGIRLGHPRPPFPADESSGGQSVPT